MIKLNYQFLRRLEKERLITLKPLYIDGTKIFVNGKGQKNRTPAALRRTEKCGDLLMKYKNNFEIMEKDKNGYSKTDLEATFMRMKEDLIWHEIQNAYRIK